MLIGWSPDGSRIAYTNELGGVEVVSSAGRKLLDLVGDNGVVVADGTPCRRARLDHGGRLRPVGQAGRASLPAVSASWSPGDLLATLTSGGMLQLRSHGVGRPSVTAHVGNGSVRWVSPTVVQVSGTVGFDVATKRTIGFPAASTPTRPSSRHSAWRSASRRSGSWRRSRVGGAGRIVTSYATCQGRNADAFYDVQALPDGSGAVYAGDCASPSDVFAVRPDGTGLTRLTHTKEDESSVTASPDGSRLAFTRTPEAECVGCDERLMVTKADGSGTVTIPLATPTDGIRQDQDPSFSPDGSSIVFSRWNSSVGDSARLYRVVASGGAASALGIVGTAPAWGPSRIAFLGPKGVATVAPDGTGSKRVPGLVPFDEGPVAWSKSGRLAVLRTTQPLGILVPSRGRVLPLHGFTEPVEHGAGLAWSPDGTKLAFVAADRDGVGDVWTINADGSGLTRVTHVLGADGTLSWR